MNITKEYLEITRKARALVAQGWGQGRKSQSSHDGSKRLYCMFGAVYYSNGGRFGNISKDVLSLMREKVGMNVAIWNDMKGRTHAEVMAIFDSVIIDLEGDLHEGICEETFHVS